MSEVNGNTEQAIGYDESDPRLQLPRCGGHSLVVLAPHSTSGPVELDEATRLDVHKGTLHIEHQGDEEALRPGQEAVLAAGESMRLSNRGDVEARVLMCRCTPRAGDPCRSGFSRW